MIFNSAIKVAPLVSAKNHRFVAKSEEIPLGCINCIEAYLFLVNILNYGSVVCIVINNCKDFFLTCGFEYIIR